MTKLIKTGAYYLEGHIVKEAQAFMTSDKREKAIKNTLSYAAVKEHNAGDAERWKLNFCGLVSDGYSYFNICRSALACGMTKFPVPYVLLGDAVTRDVQNYGHAAAGVLGGTFVSPALASPSAYVQENVAKSGEMLLSSVGCTAGALGALVTTGESDELIDQLLTRPYECPARERVVIHLKGKLRKGVGPVDVALELIAAVDKTDFFADKILEFVGTGVSGLSMDERCGIDGLMGETGCFATIWETDDKTEEYFAEHGRKEDFKRLTAVQPAYYDGAAVVDLSRVEPMIRLPYSLKIMTVQELLDDPISAMEEIEAACGEEDVFSAESCVHNGVLACDGADLQYASYTDAAEAAEILRGKGIGVNFNFKISFASQAVSKGLADNGYLGVLIGEGVTFTEFSGGMEETGAFSLYCGTEGWFDCALVDARTMAATAANGGKLISALEQDYVKRLKKYKFDGSVYTKRIRVGKGNDRSVKELAGVSPLPEFPPLPRNLLLKVMDGNEFWQTDGKIPEDAEKRLSGFTPAEDAVYLGAFSAEGVYGGEISALSLRQENLAVCIAADYTEKARASLIRWGVVPFTCERFFGKAGDYLYLSGLTDDITRKEGRVLCKLFSGKKVRDIALTLPPLTKEERAMLLEGGFINHYCGKNKA